MNISRLVACPSLCIHRRLAPDTIPGGGAGEPAARAEMPSPGLAAWLAPSDAQSLAEYVRGICVQAIIPHVEARMRALNAQVRQRGRVGWVLIGKANGRART